ncbi:hypothetical protein LQ953_03405 [Sphingomonas sp. IC-56]|uniref:hypothetical protein n=1 Tax=Sphingomonas sp. IC-56 TaxID=2898529 RepID=UPI001E359760|nr:hypothetical protein [Sphingomonas sp. IC-56]MCD2323059.1 hypothetical protein [Sphingomonas sp. IC-56]
MSTGAHRDLVGPVKIERPLVLGGRQHPFFPALDHGAGSVTLRTAGLDAQPDEMILWQHDGSPEENRLIYQWMCERPASWRLWARVAHLFDGQVLHVLIVVSVRAEAQVRADAEEQARAAAEERRILHDEIELFTLDRKGRKPGLSLESGDESEPFFVMRFTERWERDRVMDWLKWQEDRFHGFRDLVEREEALALERLILAGMRETEHDIKARGLSGGGRRPLRFWRGE